MITVDPYVLQQASCQASRLVATGGSPSDEWEDVRQALILDCLRRSPKFDSSRGDWQGFVRGVMRNHAAVLVTQRFRRVRREVLIDKISRDDREAADHLGTRDDLETIDGGHYEIEAGLQLTIDVRRALDGLSPKLQNIALLLSELSVVEACVKLGKSRSGVYQLIRQLRDAFLRAGFQHVGRGNR